MRRVCEAIGVDQITQVRKIESRSWATIGQRPTIAHDGALRELTMVDLDTLGMWLATIDERRVSGNVCLSLLFWCCFDGDL